VALLTSLSRIAQVAAPFHVAKTKREAAKNWCAGGLMRSRDSECDLRA
jgi:hypothetical protein